jgi:hypothetical protein
MTSVIRLPQPESNESRTAVNAYWKKAISPDLYGPFVLVVATGTNKVVFSPGCLRTETNGPSRDPEYVLRLEDLWSQFVTQTGTKGPFGIKFVFSFL